MYLKRRQSFSHGFITDPGGGLLVLVIIHTTFNIYFSISPSSMPFLILGIAFVLFIVFKDKMYLKTVMRSPTNEKTLRSWLLTTTMILVIFPNVTLAQPEAVKTDSLQTIVTKLDSLYFDAHNNCDLQQLRSLLASDVETFHDLGGYLQGRENFMKTMRKFCSNPDHTQRSLDSGTLEAYPMEGIGLLHKADHHFYRINDDGERVIQGSGRMIILWKRNENNKWKVWDLISYDHRSPER